MRELKPTVAIVDDIFNIVNRMSRKDYAKISKFIMRFRDNPLSPGINYEILRNCRDENLRSVRIDRDYRGIVLAPKEGDVYVLLWIDHHDAAYRWASNRRAKIHPSTGALQVYSVEAIDQPIPQKAKSTKRLFDTLNDRQLNRFGVPIDLMPLVRSMKSDADLDRAQHQLPPDAYDALFYYAAGETYQQVMQDLERKDDEHTIDLDDYRLALSSDESKRKFWVVENEEELQLMLDEPLEKWRVFLHPSQRKLVERSWNGPVRVLGNAGTGKTVVAIHRACWLAKRLHFPHQRILFITYTSNLASDIKEQLKTLCSKEILAKIEVRTLDTWVYRFLKESGESRKIAYESESSAIQERWNNASESFDSCYTTEFFMDEWRDIIQGQRVNSLTDYLSVSRKGRGTSVNRKDRTELWKIFEKYREELKDDNLLEPDDAYHLASDLLEKQPEKQSYASLIVDEAQDLGSPAFRLISQLTKDNCQDNLFIVGDGHQRIYNRQIVLSRLGIKIQGRSKKLKVNYRTSCEISQWATALLRGELIDDLDASQDKLEGVLNLYHGPKPQIVLSASFDEELATLVQWIQLRQAEGSAASDLCVVTRDQSQLNECINGLISRNIECIALKRGRAENRQTTGIRVSTMHRVKGLEFSGIALMGISEGKVPHQLALQRTSDDASYEEALLREKMLLYVAATRAKRWLLLTSSGKLSPFLDGIQLESYENITNKLL